MRLQPLASLALLASACVPAQAATLGTRGVGTALIYPYYTVNKGQDTLVSVVNASNTSKQLGVFVREGYNGRIVLSFYLFLAPRDSWSAAISADGAGGARIATRDGSCTQRPAIPPEGMAMTSDAYTGVYPYADGGPTDIARTREGYIEIATFGDLEPGSPSEIAVNPRDGGPPHCGDIAPYASLVNAAGELFGSGSIVDVAQGTFYGYEPVAVNHLYDMPIEPYAWQTETWNYGPWSYAIRLTEDEAFAPAYVQTGHGESLKLKYSYGADSVSAVLAADAIFNEYLVDSRIGAQTDWVVTFPTKADYVDPLVVGSEGGQCLLHAPFRECFGASVPGASNVTARLRLHGPSGGDDAHDTVASYVLGHQVNVISFSTDAHAAVSGVLGSTLIARKTDGRTDLVADGASGWATLDFNDFALLPDASGVTVHGLPAVGFMVYNIVNANAQPGRLANYGSAFAHHATATTCVQQGSTVDLCE